MLTPQGGPPFEDHHHQRVPQDPEAHDKDDGDSDHFSADHKHDPDEPREQRAHSGLRGHLHLQHLLPAGTLQHRLPKKHHEGLPNFLEQESTLDYLPWANSLRKSSNWDAVAL